MTEHEPDAIEPGEIEPGEIEPGEVERGERGRLGDDGFSLPAAGRRAAPRRRRGAVGCLPALVGLLLVVGVLAVGYRAVHGLFGDPEDYSGKDATGRVVFTVYDADSVRAVADGLEKQDVVASADAFTDAMADAHRTVHEGVYVLKQKMKASDAAAILGDSANDRSISLNFQPGKTVDEIVALLGRDTPFSAKQYQKVLAKPDAIGLPDYAGGDPQGYLAPGQYLLGPDDTPTTVLAAMVDKFKQMADDAGLEQAADGLGLTPGDLVTVASMLQAEGRPSVQPKIARVLYNRLDHPTGPTAGFLQVDATVNFALGEPPDQQTVRLTQAQIDSVADNPYNTYRTKGLPPGPIETPNLDALKAAAHPADGPWFFYVTVNLATGRTKFATTFAEQQELKAELDHYCATKSDRC